MTVSISPASSQGATSLTATQSNDPQLTSPDGKPLDRIKALLNHAHQQGVSFCHWKTNLDLDQALAGIDDLDLLVEQSEAHKFEIALLNEQYKEAESITSRYQPGVFHFLANDETTGRLINAHVHLHTQTGDHFIKSWALPFEKLLLEQTSEIAGMPVPQKEAELIIYVIRSMIKHASLYDFLLILKKGKSSSREYEYLTEGVDMTRVAALLQQHLPEIKFELFERAMVMLGAPTSLYNKVHLGRKFKRKLVKYRRYSATTQTAITTWAVVRMAWNRLFHHHKHMVLRNGGCVIALVGPQATGKSTIAAELYQWLGVELEIKTLHAGKPPRTWVTALPSLAIPLARKLMPGNATVKIEKDAVDNDTRKFPLIFIVRKVMLAWDRRALLQKAWRQARNGKIIVSDRYPSDLVGAIDGATFRDDVIESEGSRLKRTLMKLERKIYDDICPPDLVLELTVSTEKAIERNKTRNKKGPKQTTDYVRLRHSMKYKPVFKKTPVFKISTDEDFGEMMLKIKQIIWSVV